MQIEVRKTSESLCPACGSHDLISVHDVPLTEDVTELFELELLRREAEFVKTLRAHLETERMERADALAQERAALAAHAENLLSSVGGDVARWRVFRRRREESFKLRLEDTIRELLDRTRYPMVGSRDEPDRS